MLHYIVLSIMIITTIYFIKSIIKEVKANQELFNPFYKEEK